MKQSQHFLENAENCAQLAERAKDEPTYKRYKRMEAAWRALAEEQDWLDGVVPPTGRKKQYYQLGLNSGARIADGNLTQPPS